MLTELSSWIVSSDVSYHGDASKLLALMKDANVLGLQLADISCCPLRRLSLDVI